jgi:lysophospholipase L1-like esterase
MFLLIIPAILLLDFIRSVIVIGRLHHNFYKHYKPQQDLYVLGSGPAFHIVLLGDSGIDGHGANKLKFGPAQTVIEKLALSHTVTVHIFAKESSRSYDVIRNQLPKVIALNKIDMIFVYMGANNLIRLKSARRVVKDFNELIDAGEKYKVPVVATEIADYHSLSMFSWVQRLIIYILIRRCNAQLRKLAIQRPGFILTNMRWLTKKYVGPDYMADRLHPNDPMIRLWADKAYKTVKESPTTKGLFTGIIAK